MYDGKVITYKNYLAVVFALSIIAMIAIDFLDGGFLKEDPIFFVVGKIGEAIVVLLFAILGATFVFRKPMSPFRQSFSATFLPAFMLWGLIVGLLDSPDRPITDIDILRSALVPAAFWAAVVFFSELFATDQ